MNRKLGLAAVLVLLIIGGFALGATTTWFASDDVSFDATDGPEITLGTNTTAFSDDPFPDSNTIDLGTINIYGPAGSSATLSDVSGQETTLSNIDSNGGVLWANHSSVQRVGFEDISSATWEDVDLSSDTIEITTTGAGTVYVDGFSPNEYVRVDRSADVLILQANSTGVVSVSVNGDELTFKSPSQPELINPTPVNEKAIDSSPVTLQAELQHDDIADEEIDLTWKLNGQTVKTATTTQDGLFSADVSSFTGGLNDWSLTAEDSTGDTTSVSGSFRTPTRLEIRNETNPSDLVTSQAEVEVTFFSNEDSVVTRTTTDGTIDMSGLPLNEDFTVSVDAEGYYERQSYVSSIVEQQELYILNDTKPTVETQFEVEDPTGKYSSGDTRVFVLKAITQNGQTEYKPIVSDLLGVGGWTTTLAKDERYIVELEDPQTGDRRQVGPYVARISERVPIEIEEFSFDFSGEVGDIGYQWNAKYLNTSSVEPAVDFVFSADQTIEKLTVEIRHQHTDEVILSETFRNYNGPIDLRAGIPDKYEDPDQTNWVVDWNATINGDTIESTTLVGDGRLQPNTPGLGDRVLSIVGVLVIFIVAGLFSQANVSVGAISTSLVAGGLWFVGIIPSSVSGIFIAISLMIGVMYHIRLGPQAR